MRLRRELEWYKKRYDELHDAVALADKQAFDNLASADRAHAEKDEALRLLREARNAIYELSDYGERMELKRRLNDALAAHKEPRHD